MKTYLTRCALPALFLLLPLLQPALFAQSNVRAWYADGQVWVVWQATLPFPETFAIYKKATAFSNTNQASLIGRLFHYEYLPGTYFEQTADSSFTYRIPKPDGTTYQLLPGEGLFVETVTQTGSAFYAVTQWGQAAVTAGINITSSAVNYTYAPLVQPVQCHLQHTEILASGHKTAWYSLWALGRQDENAGRPDFPVMANAAKNGMPSMFIVSQALDIDTAGGQKIPMTHWLHGSGMLANQFLANDFNCFNIEPLQGISVSHNDDFCVKTITENGDSVFTSGRSLWFGWTKNHNPFEFGFAAAMGDTVINYTQRRIMWINDWLIRHFPIDPARVSVQGYSMGSGGATVLVKSFPEKFATASLFNCGLRGAVDPTSIAMVGSVADNLPTNLRGFNDEVIRINEVFNLNTRLSATRDLPLVRIWVGKNDINERMHWGADLVAQLRAADSLGWGAQIQWDERPHTYQTLGMHWIIGFEATQQTRLDDLSQQETVRSDASFPAFFNHRLESQNNDPGSGLMGINNGDGDNWGSWGGWHRWDNVFEDEDLWMTSAWLESGAAFDNDNCPVNSLKADVAIRKPQFFKPAAGTTLNWRVIDPVTQIELQSGEVAVQAGGLVVIPQIEVYKENIRKVQISVSKVSIGTGEPSSLLFSNLKIVPNPSQDDASVLIVSTKNTTAKLRIISTSGALSTLETNLFEGPNRISLSAFRSLPGGLYWVEIISEKQHISEKWAKM